MAEETKVRERFTIKDQPRVLDEVLNRVLNGEMKPAEAKAIVEILNHPMNWLKTVAAAKKAGLAISDSLMHAIELNGAVAAALTEGADKPPVS